jgi:uncharacterized protein (TIGR03437 family)
MTDMIYASDGQSSAIVPYDITGQAQVSVQVQYNGALSKAVTLPVFPSRLGIFTFGAGSGQAAVINQDGTVNSPSNPAIANSIVSIYATGRGLPNPPGADNQITGATIANFKDSVFVSLYDDGSDPGFAYSATVLYYGSAPQAVPGLIQINAQLPAVVPPANAVPPFVVSSATGFVEQAISIAIR